MEIFLHPKKPSFIFLTSICLTIKGRIIDQVFHPIQTMEPALHSVDPFEILNMCPILDDLLPWDEVFLEYLIQSNILLDVGSVVTKSNPNFINKLDLSPYVGLVESLESPFDQ